MSLPLFTRNVGMGIQPITIPVEPLAPGKEFRAGVETAKDLPSTGLSIAKGITGAINAYNKVEADQADIEGKQISNRQEAIKLQSMEQLAPEALEAARLKIEKERDDYARELDLQKREDEFINTMRNGSSQEKVNAFWSGKYVDVFAKNKGMKEAAFDYVKQYMTPEQLQHQLGKSTDNYLARQIQRWNLNKELAKQDKAATAFKELNANPFYLKLTKNKGLGFAGPGELQNAIKNAEPLPFNSVQSDAFGNVVKDPNTGDIIRQEPDQNPLPLGFGDKDKGKYISLVLGNKVVHLPTDEYDKIVKNISDSHYDIENQLGIDNPNPDGALSLRAAAEKATGGQRTTTQTQSQAQYPQQDMQYTPIQQPPQQQSSQEEVIKRQQEAEKDTISATAMSRAGYIQGNTVVPEKKEAFKSYVGKKLELTPEETAKYGDELVKAVEIQLLVPDSQLNSFMGQAYDAKYTPGKLYNLANEIAITRSKEAENKKEIDAIELSVQRKEAVEKASKLAGVKIGDEKYTSNKVTPTPMYQNMRNIGATRTEILNKLYLIMKEAEKVKTQTSQQAVANGQAMGNVNSLADQMNGAIQ